MHSSRPSTSQPEHIDYRSQLSYQHVFLAFIQEHDCRCKVVAHQQPRYDVTGRSEPRTDSTLQALPSPVLVLHLTTCFAASTWARVTQMNIIYSSLLTLAAGAASSTCQTSLLRCDIYLDTVGDVTCSGAVTFTQHLKGDSRISILEVVRLGVSFALNRLAKTVAALVYMEYAGS